MAIPPGQNFRGQILRLQSGSGAGYSAIHARDCIGLVPVTKPFKGFANQLGAHLAAIVEPTLAARGLGETSLVTHWPEIVGETIGRISRPIELQWPAHGRKRDPDVPTAPATLVLRIDGAFALEAQHAAASIVARVNAHLGWRCVQKIAFRQGPLEPYSTGPKRAPPPSPAALTEARRLGEGIEDEGLRDALERLGARVIDSAASKR